MSKEKEIKDFLNFGVIQKNLNKDYITPHKIAVVILVKEYCLLKMKSKNDSGLNEEIIISPKNRRDFCLLILKLIQDRDLEYLELNNMLKDKYQLTAQLIENFHKKMQEIYSDGVDVLIDFIPSLSKLMIVSLINPILNKTSVIGLYVRRIITYFDKMSFSQVVSIYNSFKSYYESVNNLKSEDEMDLSESDLKTNTDDSFINKTQIQSKQDNIFWSKRQAEFFIAQQAALIQDNESKAMPPRQLQNQIKKLLQSMPEYAEAHFLSFLNCMRAKEFCGARDSLFHGFDRNYCVSEDININEETNKIYRFPALLLAVLHAHFNHTEEALYPLKEAIMMSHRSADNVCLQHAHTWLYKLTSKKKESLIERCIAKSFNLNLHYLTSLGMQSYAQYGGVTGKNPALVFDWLIKSDILNYTHCLVDLMTYNYVQKAALWCIYGKTEMASLFSQLLLNFNTTNFNLKNNSFTGEGKCLAICTLANSLMSKGDYHLASVILNFSKENFPNQPTNRFWILSEQIICFTQAINNGYWQSAEEAIAHITPISKWEAYLRHAELYISKGAYPQASICIENILRFCEKGYDSSEIVPLLTVRALLLKAELQSSDLSSVNTIESLTTALSLAKSYHLDYHAALTLLYIANLQLQMGLIFQALKLVEKCILDILSHGGLYDQARVLLLYVKCKIASISESSEEHRKESILKMLPTLNKVKSNFQKVEAFYRLKDVVYLQVLLYNDIGLVSERQKCALEFHRLDEQYPTKNFKNLLTLL